MPKHLLRLWLLVLIASVLLPEAADAIPAFSRRYALPCHFCHDGYPKLSVLGEQFKERGYRLDDDVTEIADWLRSVPVSLRSTFRQTFEEGGDAQTRGVFRVVSAGNLGDRVSYWVDDNYVVESDDTRRVGLNNAFARVELVPDEIHARGGRIELDLPFTQTRSPQLFRYEIYFANTGFETDNIGVHHDGVEVGGFVDDATRWSIAVVDANESQEQSDLVGNAGTFDANVFGRLMRRFGEGRAGMYVYWGRNKLARTASDDLLLWDDSLVRLGGDVSWYLGQAQAYGTFLYGRNSNPFANPDNPQGTNAPSSFWGGFAQVDYAIRDELVVSGRMELVHAPPAGTADPAKSFVEFFPGLKLWLHPRVRLAFELGFRNQNRPTRGAIHLELVI
jgi:hypothetical protein